MTTCVRCGAALVGDRCARCEQRTPSSRPAPLRAREVVSRVAQAQRLYEQALLDVERGQIHSATNNLKLALTFDPGCPVLVRAFRALPPPPPRSEPSTTGRSAPPRATSTPSRPLPGAGLGPADRRK